MIRLVALLVVVLLLLSGLAALVAGVAAQPLSPNLAAPLVTPVWLGNPIAGQAYSARHIRDLQAWRGRIYLAYGDWYANLGPVDIWYYTPTAGLFLSETVYASPDRPAVPVDEESIERYVVIDGDLYIPGADPREPWDLGNFYRNEGSGWIKYRTIPNGIHAFDLSGYGGKLFAAIGPWDSAALVRSGDGGLTWTAAISETGSTRFYELYELDGTLFAVQSPTEVYTKPAVYRYQAPGFVSTTIELVPDRPQDLVVVMDGVFAFRDTILYSPWFRDDAVPCARALPDLYQAGPEQNGRPVPFFAGTYPHDLVVTEEWIFVLDAGGPRCYWDDQPPDPAGYTSTIYASADLVDWTPVATAHFADTPNALEVVGDRAYVGTYNGDIYALDMTLPLRRVYLPLVLRTPAP